MSTYPIDENLTAIAIAFKNPDTALIADSVMPRVTPVTTKQFKYTKHNQPDAYTVPDTKVGRRSAPNMVHFSGTEESASVNDYGLSDSIPMDDINQAQAGRRKTNPLERSTMMLTNLMELDREVRVAGVVFNNTNYEHKVNVAAAAKWTEASYDVIGAIEDALNTPLVRPNIMTLGLKAWSALRKHPFIVSATQGNDGTKGLASKQAVADLFELQEIHVGNAFVNTAKRGKAATYVRAWGNHCSLTYRDRMASADSSMTWGMTVPYGTREVRSEFSKDVGARGGMEVRVVESYCELVTAPGAGYFFENVI